MQVNPCFLSIIRHFVKSARYAILFWGIVTNVQAQENVQQIKCNQEFCTPPGTIRTGK